MSDETQASPVLELADGLRRLIDEAVRKVELVNAGYHIVIVPDSGPPEHKACIDGSEAAEFLRLNYNRDAHVFVFHGRACHVEHKPPRLSSDEGVFPLFVDDAPAGRAARSAMCRLGQPAPPPPPSRSPEVDDVDPMPLRGRDDGDDGDPEDDELDPD